MILRYQLDYIFLRIDKLTYFFINKILFQAISESLQSSLRVSRSQLINQELTIRPEANIESNIPEGLDLYKVIFEVESDSDTTMNELDGTNQTKTSMKQVSRHFYYIYFPTEIKHFHFIYHSNYRISKP